MTGRLRSMGFAALAAAMLLVPAGARAALSPYWQSAKEFAAIVNDQRVNEALKYEEAIQSIRLTAPDVYELTTERCTPDDRDRRQAGEARPHGAAAVRHLGRQGGLPLTGCHTHGAFPGCGPRLGQRALAC